MRERVIVICRTFGDMQHCFMERSNRMISMLQAWECGHGYFVIPVVVGK